MTPPAPRPPAPHDPRPGIRLLGPDRSGLPPVLPLGRLDPAQLEAARALLAGTDVVVQAPPRAGRTVLALAAAAAAAEPTGPTGPPGTGGSEGEVLLLAPRRASAARLRDALAVHGTDGVRVMTPAALGFALVRAASAGQGRGEPTLVTGADQDLLLAELVGARTDWHLEVDPAARALPGFRAELRELLTRAGDLGLAPADLDELGRRHLRPAWRDAAALYRDYLGVLDLEAAAALDAGPRLDSGALVRRAADLVSAGAVPAPARVIVVDDAQDLTDAGTGLVLALLVAGARALVTSAPDEAVETFRGAVPAAASRIAARAPRPVRPIALDGTEREPGPVAAAVDALRSRLPLAGAPAAQRRPRAPQRAPGPQEGLAVLRAVDPVDESRLIAGALRDLHHREQIPYDDMAVVCRSQAAVRDVADLLARDGLPVRTPRRARPLREEAVVLDLLALVEIGLGAADGAGEAGDAGQLDPLQADGLLRGPYGDADTLRLRRIRRLLLAARDPEDDTASEVLLARALRGEHVPGLPDPADRDRAAAPVHRLRAMIRAVREQPEGEAQEVLWRAWEAAGLAEGWRRAALGVPEDVDGARARLAGERLDTLMELFAAAERLADRRPGAGVRELADQVRAQAVVEDSLAPAATPRGRLAVLTPAQLAGEDRDTVVLARVQEGAWPDLRLRSTLLGASDLPVLAGHDDAAHLATDPEALHALHRSQVVADEIRLAVSALSRARRRALVTAVEGDDTVPSALVEVLSGIPGPSPAGWVDLTALRTDPGPAPDPRRLVAALRRRLREEDPVRARDAARALHALAAAGAPGADPDTWYHQPPSSSTPLAAGDAPVSLSPSALERAHACPRAWLLERSGGTRPAGGAQVLGTAVHRLAQDHPDGSAPVEDLLAQLHDLLRDVPGLDTWSGRRRVRHAEDAARLLAEHLATAAPALAVEVPFSLELPVAHRAVRLRGTIDRVEGDAEGLRVVDLKTGRVAKSAADAAQDLQLAAYQTAVRAGALDDALGEDAADRLRGAELVHLGTGGRRAAVRTQPPLDAAEDPQWFDRVVGEVADTVSGARVVARRNAHCSRCAVRSSCPLQPEGGEL